MDQREGTSLPEAAQEVRVGSATRAPSVGLRSVSPTLGGGAGPFHPGKLAGCQAVSGLGTQT